MVSLHCEHVYVDLSCLSGKKSCHKSHSDVPCEAFSMGANQNPFERPTINYY